MTGAIEPYPVGRKSLVVVVVPPASVVVPPEELKIGRGSDIWLVAEISPFNDRILNGACCPVNSAHSFDSLHSLDSLLRIIHTDIHFWSN